MVMMLQRRLRLMWLIIAASAVDFPDPVTPVTNTSPRGFKAMVSSTPGSLSSLTAFTSYGIARKTKASVPRCWNTLVRNRPTPGTPIAKSASLCSANSLTWRGVMICSASPFNSSGLSACCCSGMSSPATRIVGGRPTLRWRSDPPFRTISVMAALKLNADIACAGSAIGIHPEEHLTEFHGLRVLDGDLPDHAGDLGVERIHDLHRFNDAQRLAGADAAAHPDVWLRARLRLRVE